MEDERAFIRVDVLLFQEGNGMISPMPHGVEMVGCMVAIVKAESVTLTYVSTELQRQRLR